MRGTALATLDASLALDDVIQATGGRLLAGRLADAATGVSIDSRTVGTGELFVAIAGPRFDGHDFLAEAAARGAVAALVHRDVAPPPGLAAVRVADTTAALADLARHVRRLADLPVVAITGSTGKTTTKNMTAALLEARGAVLRTEGNLNNRFGLPLTMLRLRHGDGETGNPATMVLSERFGDALIETEWPLGCGLRILRSRIGSPRFCASACGQPRKAEC